MKALKLTQIKSHGLKYDFWRYQLWEYVIWEVWNWTTINGTPTYRREWRNGRILHHARTWHEASKLFNELAPQYAATDFETLGEAI
jgi:hypothetical protein